MTWQDQAEPMYPTEQEDLYCAYQTEQEKGSNSQLVPKNWVWAIAQQLAASGDAQALIRKSTMAINQKHLYLVPDRDSLLGMDDTI